MSAAAQVSPLSLDDVVAIAGAAASEVDAMAGSRGRRWTPCGQPGCWARMSRWRWAATG